ncbi:unnamed protein product [Bursaphelenchus xylophilus]|uniref:(pine wood nematode) hypothetical protein n=1 Tax=Bursaphelenchus xylophilus TaxID=6326 RepID=A0A1I7RTS7_BURXY|nr:unnamed protein product [Bursaphelenchus xylophilus]CAG9122151.1 unnamed protein product [Bursaphelenchus xylophilus]
MSFNSGGIQVESDTNGLYRRNDDASIKQMRKKGLPWILTAVVILVLVLLAGLLYFVLKDSKCTADSPSFTPKASVEELTQWDWPRPRQTTVLASFTKAAIVSDNAICSEIGRSILLRGGNAVDVAIAVGICIGGLHPHSSGLGGGFLMTYYDKEAGKCRTLDARETAPLATNQNSFHDNPKDAFLGPKSIATPGELHGFWSAFKRFSSGRIPWSDLLMPTVKLLNNGYPATKLMELNLQAKEADILAEPSMKPHFTNSKTGKLYKEGDIIKNPTLAETLRRLAVSTDPVRTFYKGEMGDLVAFEIKKLGGHVTKKDLEQYKSKIDEKPITTTPFGDELTICGPKPSSSSAVTQLILSIMARFYPIGSKKETVFNDVEYYHRFIEAQKFAYAQRTKLGDPDYVHEANGALQNMTSKEFIDQIVEKISEKTLKVNEYGSSEEQLDDKGTSQISVIDADGNAVSLTSSVNNIFGSLVRSERLGIVWNDQMDDFSLPGSKNFFGFTPAKANYIEPGKRPLSSMSPIIIYNSKTKEAEAAVGAAGGSKIISAVAQVILQKLAFNQTVKEAVDFPRIHNQFTPIRTAYEKGVPQILLDELARLGHNFTEMVTPFSTVQAIFRTANGRLQTTSDFRRPVYMNPTGF